MRLIKLINKKAYTNINKISCKRKVEEQKLPTRVGEDCSVSTESFQVYYQKFESHIFRKILMFKNHQNILK